MQDQRNGNGNDKRAIAQFNGVKVFSATMAAERERLGDKVTDWLLSNPSKQIVDTVVTQSSDEAFHCIAITVFFWQGAAEQGASR